MAKRSLLHREKLKDFKAWLEDNHGWCIHPNKGQFEVLRWSKDDEYGGAMPIIYNGKSPVHYSCNEAAAPYVRKFINQSKG